MADRQLDKTDIIIVGAGVIGLSIARELKHRYPDVSICILEKESAVGKHASGRNSGVLHSGIYYPPESLKAKVCLDGARQLARYCRENHLPFDPVGKVIVPTRAEDDSQLDVLYDRATRNGARVELIDAQTLKEIEPEAHSPSGRALLSPETSAFDAKAILNHLAQQLAEQGVVIQYNQRIEWIDSEQGKLITNGQTIAFGHLFNTAGLHADTVAKAFGLGKQYTILPFKGLYYKLDPKSGLDIRHHIYPVPDLRVPFLGVHFTRLINGDVTLGPTAIPAFGRENYHWLENIDLRDTPSILLNIAGLYAKNKQGFREFAHQEAFRFFKPIFVKAAQALVPRLQPRHLLSCDKVGIRAQLYDTKAGSMVMDFLVEKGERSTHILNAISPAFTSAFSFAQFVLDHYYESSENKQDDVPSGISSCCR